MNPPDAAPIESEIVDFFGDRNFERSRRFAPSAYDPKILRDFLVTIGNPQYAYETIHVAGTVGKGSTTTYLSRALTATGFRTGAYLSPHFVSLRERFLIDGEPIDADELAQLWQDIKKNPQLKNLSFFDALTALGFVFFNQSKCDWAVIETGLGGRFDSTNNLRACIAVITRIGLDHQNILGDTLEKIAWEKAGIIQPGQTVYTPAQEEPVMNVLRRAAAEQGATLKILEGHGENFTEVNRDFAMQIVADAFNPAGVALALIRQKLAEPVFGRWSELQKTPRIIFDGGHNAAAMQALTVLVNRQPESRCNIFLNTMKERNLAEFCAILQNGIQKKLKLFLFPMSGAAYYADSMTANVPQKVTDGEIRQMIGDKESLHLFTGSMAIYSELRTRFQL